MTQLLALTVACALVTYFWRFLAVIFSGRLASDSAVFHWIECVAYAMVAGVVVRLVWMPSGTLATVPLSVRLMACVVAVVVYRLSGKKLLVGMAAGVGLFMALVAWGIEGV
jgi:hypothetical protein